jgi:hypothetical protein
MAENIYENPPILFGEKDKQDEYLEKQKRITQKLLDATDSSGTTEFLVKLIYGEDHHLPVRLLDTKVEAYGEKVLELADAIESVESYNNFRGKDLAEALRYLHDKGYVMSVKFGRESSPVCYIEPPYFENQSSNYVRKEGYEPRRYTEQERENMYSAIERELKSLDPDELDRYDNGEVRAWWD